MVYNITVEIYFSEVFVMANALSVNKTIKTIDYIYKEFKKIIDGDKSVTTYKIFNNKQVKSFMPKGHYGYDLVNTSVKKTSSTQSFFYMLKRAVEAASLYFACNGIGKAEEVWDRVWKDCEAIHDRASNKSRIKDKRVEKSIKRLKNIFKDNESKSSNKLNNKSNIKNNLKKPLKGKNEKVRGMIVTIEEFMEDIEKNFQLEKYKPDNIYVLKKMFNKHFSKYIDKKTASGRYFSKCLENISDLDFDIYKELGGTDGIEDIHGMENNDPRITIKRDVYTNVSIMLKDRFLKCFPAIGKDFKLEGTETLTSSLGNEKVRKSFKQLRGVFNKFGIDLDSLKSGFHRI